MIKAKYEILADHLRETILTLEPGQRLPTLREIGKTKSVSQFTVARALNLLEEEGFVMRRSALGIYSSRPQQPGSRIPEQGKRRILLLVPDNWSMDLPVMIRTVLAERGFLSQLQRYDMQASPERWLPRLRFEGVAFIGSCTPEVLQILQKKNMPFVTQGLQYFHLEVDNTCGDERLVGALAAKHLIELGHTRVAVLVNEPHGPDCVERLRGFINQSRMMGVEAGILDCNMQWGQDGRQETKRILEEELAKGPFSYTGLFAVTDPGALSALQVFFQHKIRVPDDVSVIGSDNHPDSQFWCPPLTTLGFNLRDRANALVDILEARFAGDRSPRIQKMFEPVLIQRSSTAPPLM
jgi:DNA-binding LacI/PurR family transcriptional regulator